MGWLKSYVTRRLDRRYARLDDLAELQTGTVRPDAALTMPAEMPSEPDNPHVRLDIFKAILGPMSPGHLLDLGTGHGQFAVAAHEMGWKVTAVDARTERMPMTEGIEWVQSDVRDFQVGDYDLIALLGLYYHLELPDQRALLGQCAGTLTILDTHIATVATTEIDGHEGRMFAEDLSAPTASWVNEESFWPTEPDLIETLHEAGYRFVFRLTPPPMTVDRTWYLCY